MSLQMRVANRNQFRGDPGIFGDIFKGIKKIAKPISGVAAAGGVPGASLVNRALSGDESAGTQGAGATVSGQPVGVEVGALTQGAVPEQVSSGGFTFNVGGRSGVTLQRNPQITGRGTFGPAQVEVQATPQEIGQLAQQGLGIDGNGKLCPMKDMQPNKSSYFRRDAAGNVIFVPKGTRLVRKRRPNRMNMKATRRAIAQVKGAKKLAKQLSNITIRNPSCPSRKKKETS